MASVTAKSRIDRPCGRLHHIEVIIWLRGLLFLDIPFPDFIRHIAARRHPITSPPQMLTPIPLSQSRKFAQQFMRTLPFQVLHCPRHRYLRRDANQHVNMIPIDRPSVDHHFLAPRNFPKQFAASLAHIPGKNRIPILRRPHQMIFAVPHRMAATLIVFHPYKPSTFLRLKARGLPIPYRGL